MILVAGVVFYFNGVSLDCGVLLMGLFFGIVFGVFWVKDVGLGMLPLDLLLVFLSESFGVFCCSGLPLEFLILAALRILKWVGSFRWDWI